MKDVGRVYAHRGERSENDVYTVYLTIYWVSGRLLGAVPPEGSWKWRAGQFT
jgi:hypothetical protein